MSFCVIVSHGGIFRRAAIPFLQSDIIVKPARQQKTRPRKQSGSRCVLLWDLAESGGGAVGTENVLDLVLDHLTDGIAAGCKVLAGIEVLGMHSKVLTDGGGQSEAEVGVDVDLADRASGSLTQLLLGNADGAGHVAAELVDLGNEVLGNGGSTVQNDGEAGQTLLNFLKDVEAELGLGAGLELVSAVAGADGDGEGVNTGLGDELLDLIGTGVGGILLGDVDIVLDAGQTAELTLDNDTLGVGILNDLAGQSDVVLEGMLGTVDHNGGEAAVDAGLADLEVLTVVKVDADGQVGVLNGSLDELHQVNVLGVLAGAGGNLQDKSGVKLLGSLGDALDDLHVVDVESADGVAVGIGVLEHFFAGNQSHDSTSPIFKDFYSIF